jgi:predicted secreted protein with PEFG-CTERM motif
MKVLIIFDKSKLILMNKKFLLIPMLFLMLIPFTNVYAEHVLDIEAFAQFLDIAQLEAEKSVLEIDGNSYDIYYGYHGSLDAMGTDFEEPTVSEIIVNVERKSLEVSFEDVPEKTDFWVRIPFDVLTAEKENYQVLINEVDTGYDLMKMPDGYVVGFIISEDTKHVEIIGTKVIPEFGTVAILVLGISILGIVYVARKSPYGTNWTRIN